MTKALRSPPSSVKCARAPKTTNPLSGSNRTKGNAMGSPGMRRRLMSPDSSTTVTARSYVRDETLRGKDASPESSRPAKVSVASAAEVAMIKRSSKLTPTWTNWSPQSSRHTNDNGARCAPRGASSR